MNDRSTNLQIDIPPRSMSQSPCCRRLTSASLNQFTDIPLLSLPPNALDAGANLSDAKLSDEGVPDANVPDVNLSDEYVPEKLPNESVPECLTLADLCVGKTALTGCVFSDASVSLTKLMPVEILRLKQKLESGRLFYIKQRREYFELDGHRLPMPSPPHVLPRGVDCPRFWPWHNGGPFQYREGNIFLMSENKRMDWKIDKGTGHLYWKSTHSVNPTKQYVERIEEDYYIEFIQRIGFEVPKTLVPEECPPTLARASSHPI